MKWSYNHEWKIDILVNIEGLNYNVHMQSRAYYSQFEVALVHKLVYDFYCKYYTHVLSIYLSCDFVMTGATNKKLPSKMTTVHYKLVQTISFSRKWPLPIRIA